MVGDRVVHRFTEYSKKWGVSDRWFLMHDNNGQEGALVHKIGLIGE